MAYFAIVEQDTGKVLDHEHGASHYISDHDNNMRPYVEDTHIHVPLNDELIKNLISDDPLDHIDTAPIDWRTTHWDFNTSEWVITYLTPPPPVDPVEEKLREINGFIAEANVKLAIPDLPSSVRTVFLSYVAELQSLKPTVTAGNCANVIVPILPTP
jgi:hypothetical protein